MTDFAQTYGWYPDVYTPCWFHKKGMPGRSPSRLKGKSPIQYQTLSIMG